MRRRFQFSLRALMLALTIACLWLGWNVERARRRGKAIDAVVATGAMAYYDGDDEIFLGDVTNDRKYVAHFWADISHLPLIIEVSADVDLDATIGRQLEQVIPIQTVGFNYPVRDDSLEHLHGLNDGCEVFFWQDQNLSAQARANLRRRMPNVEFP